MEDRPKRGENAGHSLRKKTKDEDRRQRQVKRHRVTYLGVKKPPEQNCTPWQAGHRSWHFLMATHQVGSSIARTRPNCTSRNSKLWKTLRSGQRWTPHGTSETWTSSEIWSSPPQRKGPSRAQWRYCKKRKAAKISYCEKQWTTTPIPVIG